MPQPHPMHALRLLACLLLVLPAGALAASPARAGEGAVAAPPAVATSATIPWMTDYRKAQAQAKAEGKHLLLDFTGSDWCHWCHRLEDEVLGQRAFLDVVTKHYVFVFLDFPEAEALKARVVDAALSERLKQDLGVRGYPTLVLATAEGTPYARTGYREGGPEPYIDHISTLRTQAGPLLELARRGSAQANAAQFRAGFDVMAEQGFLGYPAFRWVQARAKAEDPEGRQGMKPRVEQFEEEQALDRVLSGDTGPDWTGLHALLLRSRHLHGARYVQAGYRCATWLLETRAQPREARDLARKIGTDPLFQEDPRAKQALDEFVTDCEKALSGSGR